MNRNQVFLQEMGIGVQWRLRAAPPAPETVDDAAFASAVAAAVFPGDSSTAAAPVPLPVPPVPGAAPRAAASASAAVSAVPAPPAPAPAVAVAAQSAPPSAEDSAWFDDAPALDPGADGRAAPARPGDASGTGKASARAIADMDWPALQAAIVSCTRCDLCLTRKAAVPGRGDPHAQWLALGSAPSAEDERAVRSFAGEPGRLLDNMLKAVGLAPDEDAYATTLVKCRPPQGADGEARPPSADELAACRPYLERELELAGTRIILALGHGAGKGLLGAAARGKVLRYDGIPAIATYHPADLLRKPADKGRAWADLCLAKAAHAGRA